MLCRAIIKEQEIENAQTIRSQQQVINAEVNQMMNDRWDDFKHRRLIAYRNYISAIKRVKMVKTFLIHSTLLQIMKVFKKVYYAKKEDRKLKLTMFFLHIRLILYLARKSRRYAQPEMGSFHALMVKFKNMIRYGFMLGTAAHNSCFKAIQLDTN